MPIDFECECGREFHVDDARAGWQVRCKVCGRISTVPSPGRPLLTFGPKPKRSGMSPLAKTAIGCGIGLVSLVVVGVILIGYAVYDRMEVMGLTSGPIRQSVSDEVAAGPGFPLADAKRGFQTQLQRRESAEHPFTAPPPDVFMKVSFASKLGPLGAYLTPPSGDGVKRPAIIWITGGDCNTIDAVWEDAEPENDQTASAYRKAGIVMMFPSLRGGNTNPGVREGFLGEVDDVIAAHDYLSKQEHVDPTRIYLGGHSTGGTLVMLVAESDARFRAIFAFGPVHNVAGYDDDYIPFSTSSKKEVELRSPGFWLNTIKSPTFVFEGEDGNILSLQAMERSTTNPNVHFHPISWGDHFSILAPLNSLIARKILQDQGAKTNLSFSPQELGRPAGP